jgi:hypothetical protein
MGEVYIFRIVNEELVSAVTARTTSRGCGNSALSCRRTPDNRRERRHAEVDQCEDGGYDDEPWAEGTGSADCCMSTSSQPDDRVYAPYGRATLRSRQLSG